MKVAIKTTSGESYQITIPDRSTIKDLKLLAIVASKSLKSTDLNVYNLYFKGIKLDLLETVSYYSIKDNDLIIIGSKVPEENVNTMEAAARSLSLVHDESLNSVSSPDAQDALDDVSKKDDIASVCIPQVASPKSPRSKSPVSQPTIAKKKKNSKKCNFANCNNASLRIIGNCSDCNGKFCAKHRLLENHLCSGLSNCKKAAFTRNANKLHQEQTISSKV
ncbi:Tmc1 protein [Saccharomycopsis crataegensis]|uniref:Tmc1 protein n=1 Tax=Saccharomycopsis crataegensis TaxID=43959 RepID=A0AAV5QNG2_9ASCO|nr:Tmc1 protein [Saccharomycopsis crataegensis]